MSQYIYSITSDITLQQLNSYKLHTDILENLVLSVATFKGVVSKGDEIYILFDQNIESSEKTVLDTIVLNHESSIVPQKTISRTFYPTPKTTYDTYYKTMGCIYYGKSIKNNTITSIEIISMMSSGADSYDIQIINRQNNQIIATQSFTNTSLQLHEFTTINSDNIPEHRECIDIVVRLNNSNGYKDKFAHVEQVIFWLD